MTKEACEEFMVGEGGVMHVLADGKYKNALEAIVTKGHLYPEIAKIIITQHISLAANLGNIPQALQVMEKALSDGIYIPAAAFHSYTSLEPPGFAILYGNPIFE